MLPRPTADRGAVPVRRPAHRLRRGQAAESVLASSSFSPSVTSRGKPAGRDARVRFNPAPNVPARPPYQGGLNFRPVPPALHLAGTAGSPQAEDRSCPVLSRRPARVGLTPGATLPPLPVGQKGQGSETGVSPPPCLCLSAHENGGKAASGPPPLSGWLPCRLDGHRPMTAPNIHPIAQSRYPLVLIRHGRICPRPGERAPRPPTMVRSEGTANRARSLHLSLS